MLLYFMRNKGITSAPHPQNHCPANPHFAGINFLFLGDRGIFPKKSTFGDGKR